MKNIARRGSKYLLFTITLVMFLILTDLLLHLFIRKTQDNNRYLNHYLLTPYHLPVKSTAALLNSYRQDGNSARLVYDEICGWSPAPNYGDSDSLYRYNHLGVRISDIDEKVHPPARRQILLIGDSFVHGDEVAYADTWGAILQQNSENDFEVINLGVSGYGLDQAYLRLITLLPEYHPDVIIIGMPLENMLRSVNILRPISSPASKIPFSKPRFYIQDDSLILLNRPCIPPQQVAEIMSVPERWPLWQYESLYNENYRESFLDFSIYFSMANTINRYFRERERTFSEESEVRKITVKILQGIKTTAETCGAKTIFVEIPTRYDLWLSHLGQNQGQETFQDRIRDELPVVKTADAFLNSDLSIEDFFLNTHYSRAGNEILAVEIARQLTKQKNENE